MSPSSPVSKSPAPPPPAPQRCAAAPKVPVSASGRSAFAKALGTLPKPAPPLPPLPRKTPAVQAGAHEEPKAVAKNERRKDEEKGEKGARDEIDPLDPATRRAAMLAPPMSAPVAPQAPLASPVVDGPPPAARLSLEEIMPQLVKRIAWAGDKRKGSVRLELGAGAYAGSTITVHADDGRVRLEVAGADAERLREKLDARLRRHGLTVD